MLKGKTVLLGVTGSIAAYKIAGLASMLKKQHADITVLMTQNATNFINPITFETLTGNKCLIDTFDRNFQYSVEHVALAKRADIVLIAPASANVIGKIANGIADDMLTTTVMACRCPILILSLIHISGEEPEDFCAPCGVCRQVMREFCGDAFVIILAKPGEEKVYTLKDLLPQSFSPRDVLGEKAKR